MADDVRAMSAELARDPASLVFLALGEVLRGRAQMDKAAAVALAGLERHPNNADAHDLYARILVDQGDLERAHDEWDIALRLDRRHLGALKGLGFLSFRAGAVDTALDHLEAALAVDPTNASVVQALRVVRETANRELAPPAPAEEEKIAQAFVGFEGGDHGLLLVDARGQVLAGGLRTPDGEDVGATIAGYLAGVQQEAERTARLLGLGRWRWILAEADHGNMHLTTPERDTLLLLARDRSVPSGRLAILAERAGHAARQWLAAQQP
jgi:tetratricopeptide (TPR) repeat protein